MGNHTIVYIYVLIDPRDNQIRYVGQTIDPDKRYREHLHDKTPSYRGRWVRSLLADGVQPTMTVIEEATLANWAERERFWIAWYREQGTRLVNTTDGGEGTPGRFWSEEWKQDQRKRMNEPELRRMMSLRKGRLTEDQVREIIDLAWQGSKQEDLAAQYGVSDSQIWMIIHGKSYQWLPRPSSPLPRNKGNEQLTDDQVRAIISDYKQTDNYSRTAAKFGLPSFATVRDIVNGKRYKHVDRSGLEEGGLVQDD